LIAKNLPASVRARLVNRARAMDRPFEEVFQYYAMERFLYRLSRSSYNQRFVLKGALMMRVWETRISRPTRDVDLLGQVDNSVDQLVEIVQEVCVAKVEPDGMVFDPATVTGEQIQQGAEYEGVRIHFLGLLENARARMQIDIGFGDVVVPGPMEVRYPTLLDLPAPTLRGYSRESAIAEKFQAMVRLGALNSRMKDFFDIWSIARKFDFDGRTLVEAVKKTFAKRGTSIETDCVALTPAFAVSESTKRQWSAFVLKGGFVEAPQSFEEVATFISGFLQPVAQAALHEHPFDMRWFPPGPWRAS